MRVGEEYIWAQKYRPKTVDECIIVDELKDKFQNFVEKGDLPNLLLYGTAGTGKTTIAKAVLETLGCDYIEINGSLEGRNIDTLRNTIKSFASSVSFTGGRKFVLLDEADGLNPTSLQPALRGFMEEFSANCGFILTCNFKDKIIKPLHSRCSVINFTIPKDKKPVMAAAFYKRVCEILVKEGIEYDKAVVVKLIQKHFPDFRRVLNELQQCASASGGITSDALVSQDNAMDELIVHLKNKNFSKMREWVVHHGDADPERFFRKLYDGMYQWMKPETIPTVVVTLAEYQYKACFVADQEINIVACLTELMANEVCK